MKKQIVISASRRTDIPAFYMDWFMAGIKRGHFIVENPFNRKSFLVPAGPEDVHTIVFWSKDFGPFLAGDFGKRLQQAGYHLFFNFTVNSGDDVLEPNIPPLARRLEQAAALCRQYGPQTLQWRFDPICFYRTPQGNQNNLDDFARIAENLAEMGVGWCVTSFADIYAKMRRRTAAMAGFEWIDPPVAKKISILQRMQQVLEKLGMNLYTCCEKQVLEALPRDAKIYPGTCIPNRYLAELFGGELSFQQDAGQRKQLGCGCMTARDIGGYADQPCYHNCLYCYANPKPKLSVSYTDQ
ncbi:MAG: DUF1848 domain-containing protein [Desulfobacteraceae bacterium]|nr:DUF1848 domain-containing protein [Desulfobacteraceae bacterium]